MKNKSFEWLSDLVEIAAMETADFFFVLRLVLKRRAMIWMIREEPNFKGPPALAEFFLAVIAKGPRRDAIIGDMDERFVENVKRFGRKRAVRLYWAEVIRSAAPLLWAAIKRLGIAALIVGAIRRFFGGA